MLGESPVGKKKKQRKPTAGFVLKTMKDGG